MQMFKTSRGPVREALKAVEQKKLVEIRPGSGGGAVVLPIGTELLSETLAMLVRNRQVPARHIAEFREVLEGLSASLAADRIDQKGLGKLEEAWRDLEKLLTDNKLKVFWARERNLHRLLARESKNMMCQWALDTINKEIAAYQRLYPDQQVKAQEALADWKEIIKAVANKHSTRASSLLKAHVVRFSLLGEE